MFNIMLSLYIHIYILVYKNKKDKNECVNNRESGQLVCSINNKEKP